MERTGSISKKVVSPDLKEEREKANFKAKELSNVMWYNPDYYKEQKEIAKIVHNDPILKNTHEFYDMTREEQQVHVLKRTKRAFELNKKLFFHNITPYEYAYWFTLHN